MHGDTSRGFVKTAFMEKQLGIVFRQVLFIYHVTLECMNDIQQTLLLVLRKILGTLIRTRLILNSTSVKKIIKQI